MTTTEAVVVRRAGTQDAAALLAISTRFVARSPFWGLVPPDDEKVRATILQGLGGAAGTAHLGAVFVLLDESARTYNEPPRIAGFIVGTMTSPTWSLAVVAEEVGGWVDEKHADRIEDLRDSLRKWARSQRAPVIRVADAVEKL